MDQLFHFHLQRLRAATIDRFTLAQLPQWICKNTYHEGELFNFKDHEYQERILREGAQETVIRKCSQVGISELSVRMALGLCSIVPFYKIGYTLPTADFASKFMRTRIDPVIESSPYLLDAVHRTNDNSEVKQFGGSLLWVKGSQSANAPISIPVDHLFHDEVDYSDDFVIAQYQSRITHSKYRRMTKLSTPTLPNRGIDAAFQASRRHFNLVKCSCCTEWFLPDYYKHVRIPGWNQDLLLMTAAILPKTQYQQAYVECPKCGGAPSLQPEFREWVVENPDEPFEAAGFQVSPFDAPNIATPSFLVKQSTKARKRSDFVNANLGLPMEDAESTLLPEDLDAITIERSETGNGVYVFGLDMGMDCHLCVDKIMPDRTAVTVHKEIIPYGKVQERRRELFAKFFPRITVVDKLPYTETVLQMQREDINLFAGEYRTTKGIDTHRVMDQEADDEKGKLELRQVSINRNNALDALMGDIRAKRTLNMKDELDPIWRAHLQDMKRQKVFTNENELAHVWKKSKDGQDHFHHAKLYAWVAAQMLGVSGYGFAMPVGVSTMKTKL